MKKKTSNVTNCLTVYFAMSLFSQASFAGITGVRTKPGATPQSGNIKVNETVTPPKVTTDNVGKSEGTSGTICETTNADKAKYFPLSFFESISFDGSPLTFEQKPDNKIVVKMPSVISSCGTFKASILDDSKNSASDKTIVMELSDGKTYAEYIKCLEEKKILVDGKIDHDKAEGKSYAEYSSVVEYKYDRKKDIKETVKLSYGFPKAYISGIADKYLPSFGFDKDVSIPDSTCMVAEKIGPEITYINEGRDVLIQKLKDTCRSGTAQEIAEARKSIGNAEALRDIAGKLQAELDAGYLEKVKEDVAKIYAKMTEIENKIGKFKEPFDEGKIAKLVEEYATQAKELDKIFLNPAIMRLDSLVRQVADMDSENPRKEKIEKEIKALNDDIRAFSARSKCLQQMYPLMEQFALIDSARTINDIRKKSFLYSNVNNGVSNGKGKSLTMDEAQSSQVASAERFEKDLTDWADVAAVKNGNDYPLVKTQKELTAVNQKMNNDLNKYQKYENEKGNEYCASGWTGSVKNPVKCKEFQAGAQARYNTMMKRHDKDLAYVGGRMKKLNRLSSGKSEYDRKKTANDMRTGNTNDDSYYGASSVDYESSMSDNFPGYTGYTPYDPSNYNMGGQQQQNMNMGNQYNPYMVNAQMPVQQGQYQMQQQQWPSVR